MKDTRRSINAKFWTDPGVEDMSKGATYLFLSLMTFPENNMAGIYEISDRKISMYTKMSKDDVAIAMNELSQNNKIMRSGTWICIRNHIKNQKLNPNMTMSVLKDLCPAPLPVKLWVLQKLGSNDVVEWVEEFVFSINSYYRDQRNRIAKADSDKGNDLVRLNSALSKLPEISVTKEDLLKIITNPLPFKPEELSKYNCMVTITHRLPNLATNMKYEVEDRSMKIEEGRRKIEGNFPSPPKFEEYKKPKLDQLIDYWNSKSNLPKTRMSTMNLGERARDLLSTINLYTISELFKSVDNYHTIQNDSETYDNYIKYSDVFGFIKSGVEKFHDDSKPLETYRAKSKSPSASYFKKNDSVNIAKPEYCQKCGERKVSGTCLKCEAANPDDVRETFKSMPWSKYE